MCDMNIFLIVIVWAMLGIISCELCWYGAFKKQPEICMVIVSAILGPIAVAINILFWAMGPWYKKN